MLKLKLRAAVAAALIGGSLSGVQAQVPPAPGQPQPFTFNGAGTITCSQASGLLANREARLQFEQWLHGYLAAYNHYVYPWHRVQLPDANSMMNYVENWCRSNPQERILGAAGALVRELGGSPAQFR